MRDSEHYNNPNHYLKCRFCQYTTNCPGDDHNHADYQPYVHEYAKYLDMKFEVIKENVD